MSLSSIVSRQIPPYIKEQYPKFVSFIETYYEFLETVYEEVGTVDGGPSPEGATLLKYVEFKEQGNYYTVLTPGYFKYDANPGNPKLDSNGKPAIYADERHVICFNRKGTIIRLDKPYVKKLLNGFVEKELSSNAQFYVLLEALYNELMYSLPKTKLDDTFLLQNAKDIYNSKGSEECFKFLFRALYDTEVDLYYPSDQVFKPSSGAWIQKHSVLVRGIYGDGAIIENKNIEVLSKNKKIPVDTYSVEVRLNEEGISNVFDMGFVTQIVKSIIELGYVEDTVEDILDALTYNEYFGKIYEVSIDRRFYGKINVNDIIIHNDGVNTFAAYIISTTMTTELFSEGKNFKVGDLIVAETPDIPTDDPDKPIPGAKGTKLKVSKVDSDGKIKNLDFLTFGYEYKRPFVIEVEAKKDPVITFMHRGPNDGYDYPTTGNLRDKTNGFIETGYCIKDVLYSFDDGCVVNVEMKNLGQGYTNASVTFSNPPSGVRATGVPVFEDYTIRQLSGLISKSKNTNVLLGDSNTKFLTELSVGDIIKTQAGKLGAVQSIETNRRALLNESNSLESLITIGRVVNTRISDIRITNAGRGYLTAPTITITGNGTGAQAVCYTGRDLSFAIDYCGEVVSRFNSVRVDRSFNDDSRAVIKINPGSVARYPGYYDDNKGFLSDEIYLQDGYLYQDFSYIIKSTRLLEEYDSYIKSSIHPAGTVLFNEYSLLANVGISYTLAEQRWSVEYQFDVTDTPTFTDVLTYGDPIYKEQLAFNDPLNPVDEGILADNPYTLPIAPYSLRMWEDYTEGDIVVDFTDDD